MNPASAIKVTKASGPKKCKPFILEVMVFNPESGYKFEVLVERSCTADNDSLWKLVFDLLKKQADGTFETLVHVSFRPTTTEEQVGIQSMVVDGVNREQSRVLVDEVHPAAKALEGVEQPTPEQKEALRASMSRAAKATPLEVAV